ncbi:ABC transporter ATP-binding protein [Halalkalibacter krulwichiae]|uniref:Oligopeptide transport ATP-binding protein OppD n=1 Tax=Halalkalibacter krulwichiae TaxID=199441 RepID=A0A1X9MJU3_9BACI|nr:ABC transporter ATP-binding protein [Halalkalibacter krulwichiae]ARK30872.1 Oligopeptide transport ATP-binding protein OppD [Halalkalibacter krulwichiae]
MNELLLSIQDLKIINRSEESHLLKKVHLEIKKGEIVGLIGESGSGKSLTAKAIMRLLSQDLKAKGQILFKNEDISKWTSRTHRKKLGNEIGYIFQDYRSSFTPYIKIGKQIVETICAHQKIRKKEAQDLAIQSLHIMGLDSKRVYQSYSFQLSGGQVQRAAIAMALALKPALLICDEITTALDVLNGEKVLHYLDQLRNETGCSVLMITHDLTKAYKWTDRMYVMQQGEIVEEGLPEEIRCHHKHPYTKKLCSCLLALPEDPSIKKERLVTI